MRKLLVSLGLLLSFSAAAGNEYRCDFIAMDVKEERVIIDVKKVTRVIVTKDKILFGLIDDKLSECNINIRKGEYIGSSTQDCFFNTKKKHFMVADSNYLLSYDNCREITYK